MLKIEINQMHAIDTNVLVRLIVHDDDSQSRKALEYIKVNKEIFISHIVLCEFSWVFITCYKFKKQDLLKALEGILRTEQFIIENSDTVWAALHEYQNGKADFSDCLIGSIAKHNSCIATGTFDKKAAELSYFELIK